jgi:uncharacterized protein
MVAEQIHPIVNDLNRPFWEAAESGRLLLPFCINTQLFFWPPGPFSPFAFPGEVIWKEAECTGVLEAIAIFRRPFQRAFEPHMPYAVGLMCLTAGPRMQVHISRPDSSEAPRVGEAAKIYFASAAAGGPKIPVARRLVGADSSRS